MSNEDKDETKIGDLLDTDIDAENLAKIEAMGALLKSAPKESAKSNWGFAQAQAVVAVLEKKELEPGLLQRGQAIASMLGLDDIKIAQENVPKISMEGWESQELALQAYLRDNPGSGACNLDDLRIATLSAIYSIQDLVNPEH